MRETTDMLNIMMPSSAFDFLVWNILPGIKPSNSKMAARKVCRAESNAYGKHIELFMLMGRVSRVQCLFGICFAYPFTAKKCKGLGFEVQLFLHVAVSEATHNSRDLKPCMSLCITPVERA